MDCTLSITLAKEIGHAQTELERLDGLFSETFNRNGGKPALNPSAAFMAAWHKVKTARQVLLFVQLEEVTSCPQKND